MNLPDKKNSVNNNADNIFDGDWIKLVDNLKIGLAKSLAQECSLINYEDCIFNLALNEKFQHLTQNGYIEKLEEVLINHFNRTLMFIRFTIINQDILTNLSTGFVDSFFFLTIMVIN